MTTNLYQMVTDRIVAQMEKGIIPWHKPWVNTVTGEARFINYVSRQPYSGINCFLLDKTGEWLTLKQANACGGHVRKGEKSSMVVFFKMQKHTEEDKDGNKVEVSFPMLRSYNVFHISQCEGIESKMTETDESSLTDERSNENAERIINDYVNREATLTYHCDMPSNRAYYAPGADEVVVPMKRQYEDIAEFYSTAFHELTHSTLIESRCNRKGAELCMFGSQEYSREELVAEIGSAMLVQTAGIDAEKAFRNSVAYLQGWAKHLKSDPRAIVVAAGKAQKACEYILHGKQSENA